ncbi:unnamed protein product, partial [Mesorhabditis belari]|uniref:Uncharacterized protein n=1 Tax=Mesorhabditis belari TaxID=2138241 RepID=A0AAF3FM78_9BILA
MGLQNSKYHLQTRNLWHHLFKADRNSYQYGASRHRRHDEPPSQDLNHRRTFDGMRFRRRAEVSVLPRKECFYASTITHRSWATNCCLRGYPWRVSRPLAHLRKDHFST